MKSVSIIGAGAVGHSLAFALRDGGCIPEAIYSKSIVSASTLARSVGTKSFGAVSVARLTSKIVIISVPDAEIGGIAALIAGNAGSLKGMIFLHTSGALTSDELLPLRRKGGSVGSMHPLQTFSKRRSRTEFANVYCAIEGDALAVKAARAVARIIGARHFTIRKKDKIIYHIAAVFASNYLVTLLSVSERLGRTISIPENNFRKIIAALVNQTVENVLHTSPADALTGPIKRGDGNTVSKHIRKLESTKDLKHLLPLYAALGMETARLAKRRK